MRIGILSRHSVANYGSLLQAYALQTVIEKLGYEAININYTPIGEVGGNLAKTLSNVSRWSKNPITKLLFFLYQYPSCSHTFSKFKMYRKEYLKETKEYHSTNELSKDLPNVDLFCTGSDQVWNVLYDNKIDDTYFFDFLPPEKNRIAFSASFGGNSFSNNDINKYMGYLNNYDFISVREDSGVKILREYDIKGIQVLDPTLLLSSEDWEKKLPIKEKKKDFILIYQLRPNKKFDDYAKQLSKKTGLKLVRISTMYFQRFKCGEFHYLPKPEEFLWYIKNATYLLTDSFHGTCFAINFNTQFIEILPGRFNARNRSLLKIMGVENRILADYDNLDLCNNKIDYRIINDRLKKLKEDSIEVLKQNLKKYGI